MIPGEYRLRQEDIECNVNRKTVTIRVRNEGDRPIQVGSHYHFSEVNRMLTFDRELVFGMRLNIASGTAVRFEPGEEREVDLVMFGGSGVVHGFNDLTAGSSDVTEFVRRAKERQFIAEGDHS
ncbi:MULTISPECIES: urease subunit beta [unclassified Geomicrobium]|uniref:urease subunit beta n=1 Tax=unclassified Geomicrobium TaxID=2628951 RepID=UPI00045EDC01|nr:MULTISPECIES: urease subunit beta [unclassified Geomicrobium]GAJ98244.1 urease beta subunit [Geomicrobium sp. JCM 19055]GAK07719.1 urease beta subunit [Geomicrobium sp. JCM 19038]